jgi:predicted transcriptional regulator
MMKMITMDDEGIHICLKTPEEIRQAIANEIQELDQAEIQAGAAFANEMQRIKARREALEEMWRKTYETD